MPLLGKQFSDLSNRSLVLTLNKLKPLDNLESGNCFLLGLSKTFLAESHKKLDKFV